MSSGPSSGPQRYAKYGLLDSLYSFWAIALHTLGVQVTWTLNSFYRVTRLWAANACSRKTYTTLRLQVARSMPYATTDRTIATQGPTTRIPEPLRANYIWVLGRLFDESRRAPRATRMSALGGRLQARAPSSRCMDLCLECWSRLGGIFTVPRVQSTQLRQLFFHFCETPRASGERVILYGSRSPETQPHVLFWALTPEWHSLWGRQNAAVHVDRGANVSHRTEPRSPVALSLQVHKQCLGLTYLNMTCFGLFEPPRLQLHE